VGTNQVCGVCATYLTVRNYASLLASTQEDQAGGLGKSEKLTGAKNSCFELVLVMLGNNILSVVSKFFNPFCFLTLFIGLLVQRMRLPSSTQQP